MSAEKPHLSKKHTGRLAAQVCARSPPTSRPSVCAVQTALASAFAIHSGLLRKTPPPTSVKTTLGKRQGGGEEEWHGL